MHKSMGSVCQKWFPYVQRAGKQVGIGKKKD